MITALYAGLLALFLVKLARGVIAVRINKKIVFGDGNDLELQTAIRMHQNALEYVPVFLILMLLLEVGFFGSLISTFTGSDITGVIATHAVLNLCGIAMLVGRFLHAKALRTENIPQRILSMRITFYTLLLLAFANILSGAFLLFELAKITIA